MDRRLEMQKAEDNLQDISRGKMLPSVQARNKRKGRDSLPLWRKISNSEEFMGHDRLLQPMTLDAITIFSMRPAELRFVRNASKYFRWFYRDTR